MVNNILKKIINKEGLLLLNDEEINFLEFEKISFKYINITNSYINRAIFKNVVFENVQFYKTSFFVSKFDNCEFKNVFFDANFMERVSLKNCKFSNCTFENNKIKLLFSENNEFYDNDFIQNYYSGKFINNNISKSFYYKNIFDGVYWDSIKFNDSVFVKDTFRKNNFYDLILNNSFFVDITTDKRLPYTEKNVNNSSIKEIIERRMDFILKELNEKLNDFESKVIFNNKYLLSEKDKIFNKLMESFFNLESQKYQYLLLKRNLDIVNNKIENKINLLEKIIVDLIDKYNFKVNDEK